MMNDELVLEITNQFSTTATLTYKSVNQKIINQ